MAKETPRMGVVPDAKDQAVEPGDEERYPGEALIRSVTSDMGCVTNHTRA